MDELSESDCVCELSLSGSTRSVVESVVVLSATDAEPTSLKLSEAESPFLDFFVTRLVALDCGGEAGDAVREVSLTVLLREWPLTPLK